MDQRPPDDDFGPRTRTTWDRATRRDDGSWSLFPILLVLVLIVIGGWMLFGDRSTTTPATSTSENTPATAPATPPAAKPAPAPSTPAPSTPAPATKP